MSKLTHLPAAIILCLCTSGPGSGPARLIPIIPSHIKMIFIQNKALIIWVQNYSISGFKFIVYQFLNQPIIVYLKSRLKAVTNSLWLSQFPNHLQLEHQVNWVTVPSLHYWQLTDQQDSIESSLWIAGNYIVQVPQLAKKIASADDSVRQFLSLILLFQVHSVN